MLGFQSTLLNEQAKIYLAIYSVKDEEIKNSLIKIASNLDKIFVDVCDCIRKMEQYLVVGQRIDLDIFYPERLNAIKDAKQLSKDFNNQIAIAYAIQNKVWEPCYPEDEFDLEHELPTRD